MQLKQFVSLHLHTEHHAMLMLSDIYEDHQTNHTDSSNCYHDQQLGVFGENSLHSGTPENKVSLRLALRPLGLKGRLDVMVNKTLGSEGRY